MDELLIKKSNFVHYEYCNENFVTKMNSSEMSAQSDTTQKLQKSVPGSLLVDHIAEKV